MSTKHITDLRIENFRGFDELKLSGLGHVNLIVGENNSGKTSFLEALSLVSKADQQAFSSVPGLFRLEESHANEKFYRWMLNDAPHVETGAIEALGPSADNSIRFLRNKERHTNDERTIFQHKDFVAIAGKRSKKLNFRSVAVQNKDSSALVKRFGDAVRPRTGEEIMHEVLRSVDPRITRIRVDPTEFGNLIAVDIGLSESIPISQAGQGIYRLVAILSELLGESPQICVIDEIENGIHYTALPRIWAGLAKIALLLDIQIFATTHSRECLEAAQRVFCEDDEKGVLDLAVIQLMRVKGRIVGRVLDEERINDAVEVEIELR